MYKMPLVTVVKGIGWTAEDNILEKNATVRESVHPSEFPYLVH